LDEPAPCGSLAFHTRKLNLWNLATLLKRTLAAERYRLALGFFARPKAEITKV
jgi:hypothetical protein